MLKKVVTILVIFIVININNVNIIYASLDFNLYFQGSMVDDGIIHYGQDNVAIGISSNQSNFSVYVNGTYWTDINGNYGEITLNKPSGDYQIYIVNSGTASVYKVYNFYKDTFAGGDSVYTYASYEIVVANINGKALPNIEQVSYIGEVVSLDEIEGLFVKYRQYASLTEGQQYTLSGWIRVRIFNNDNSIVGQYNCKDGTIADFASIFKNLYDSGFGWSESTIYDFETRRSWSATMPFTEDQSQTPTPTPVPTGQATPRPSSTPGPTSSQSPAPTATPIPNLAPVANINARSSVKAGEDINVDGSSSYDMDGSIVEYFWSAPSAAGQLYGPSGNIWYGTPGSYSIDLTVADNRGGIGSCSKTIIVDDPVPIADISVTGSHKENRKVVISAEGSISPTHYPIDHTRTEWTVTAADGNEDNIKYMGLLTGSSKDILFKSPGTYHVNVKVTNIAGFSDIAEKTIEIGPDISPSAGFKTPNTVLRDPTDMNMASIVLADASESFDNDDITQRVWSYRYDSDNDGNFEDEEAVILDLGNKTQVELKTDQVGKYIFELWIKEDFGQATINDFIEESDYRTDVASLNGLTKDRIVDVINTAPVTSFEIKPVMHADIEIQYDASAGLDEAEISGLVNAHLIPGLAANNISAEVQCEYVETGVSIDKTGFQGEVTFQPASNSFKSGSVNAYVTGEYLIEYQSGNFVVFNYLNGNQITSYKVDSLALSTIRELRASAHSSINSQLFLWVNNEISEYNPIVGYYDIRSTKSIVCIDYLSGEVLWTATISVRWGSDTYYGPYVSLKSAVEDKKTLYVQTAGTDKYGLITINTVSGEITSQNAIMFPSGHKYIGTHPQSYNIYTYYITTTVTANGSDDTVHFFAYDIRTGAQRFYKPYAVHRSGHKYFIIYNSKGFYMVIIPRVPYIDDIGYNRYNVKSAAFNLEGGLELQYCFNPAWGQWYEYFSAGKSDRFIAFKMYVHDEARYAHTYLVDYTTGASYSIPSEYGDFNNDDSLVTSVGDWVYIHRDYDNDRSHFLISYNTADKTSTKSYYNIKSFQVVSSEFGVLRYGYVSYSLNNYNFIKLASLKKNPGYNPKLNWGDNLSKFSVFLSNQADLSTALNGESLNTLITNNVSFVGVGNNLNKQQIDSFILSNNNNGLYLENTDISLAFRELSDFVISKSSTLQSTDCLYILAGSTLDTTVVYSDRESDPKYAEKWMYVHDPYYYENSLGTIDDSGIDRAVPYISLDKPGRYDVSYQARDNPKGNDYFDSYRLWSKPEGAEKSIYVHRAPVAELSFTISGMNELYMTPEFINLSYDLDHLSVPGKGIALTEAKWKQMQESSWNDGLPEQLMVNNKYIVVMRVRDIDGPEGLGTWSEPYSLIIDTAVLVTERHPPELQVDPTSMDWINSSITINITATDEYGDYKQTHYAFSTSDEAPGFGWATSGSQEITLMLNENGIYYLHLIAEDSNGSSSYAKAGPYKIDIIPPDISVNPIASADAAICVNVAISAADLGGSGVKALFFAWSELSERPAEGWQSSFSDQAAAECSLPGDWYLHVRALDNAGNITDSIFGIYRIEEPEPELELKNLRIVNIADYQWEHAFTEGIMTNDMPVYNNLRQQGIKTGYMVSFEIDAVGLTEEFGSISVDVSYLASDGSYGLYFADLYVPDKNREYVLLQDSEYINDSVSLTAIPVGGPQTWRFDFFVPPGVKVVKQGEAFTLFDKDCFNNDLLVIFDIIAINGTGGSYDYTLMEQAWGRGDGSTYGCNLPSGLDLIGKGINHGEVLWYDLSQSALDDLTLQREW